MRFSPHGTLRVWRGKGRWKITLCFVHLYQLFPVKEEGRKTMRKCFCGREKQKLFFVRVPWTSKERVLITSSTLMCYVWVFMSVDLSVSVSPLSLLVCTCVYLCVYTAWTHTHTHKPQGFGVPCVHVNVKWINGTANDSWPILIFRKEVRRHCTLG